MRQYLLKISKLKALPCAILLVSAGASYAAGFQLWEQDASDIGDYHAAYATPDNASAVYYNPAALADLHKIQLSTGATVIQLNLPFNGTIQANTLSSSYTVNNVQAGTNNLVPNFYLSLPVSDRLTLGVGAASPFGLSTDYPEDAVTRYAATQTTLKTVDLTPSLGYRLNDFMSIGAGADIEYLWGNFNQYIPFSGDLSDPQSLNKGDSWGAGYHLGLLFNLGSMTQLGLAYHSIVQHYMTGSSQFVLPGAPIDEVNNLNGRIKLPATTSITLQHHFNQRWTALGTADFTEWGEFHNLILNNVEILGQPTQVTVHEGYKNSWNFALGVHYRQNDQFTWKAGIGYDETPTNDAYRNLQLPGEDLYAVAVGVNAKVSQAVTIAGGYTHLFQKTAHVNVTQTTDPISVTTQGSVNGGANVVGLQLIADLSN